MKTHYIKILWKPFAFLFAILALSLGYYFVSIGESNLEKAHGTWQLDLPATLPSMNEPTKRALQLVISGGVALASAHPKTAPIATATAAPVAKATEVVSASASMLTEPAIKRLPMTVDAKNKKLSGVLLGIKGSADFTVVSDEDSILVIKCGERTIHMNFLDEDTLEVLVPFWTTSLTLVFNRVK